MARFWTGIIKGCVLGGLAVLILGAGGHRHSVPVAPPLGISDPPAVPAVDLPLAEPSRDGFPQSPSHDPASILSPPSPLVPSPANRSEKKQGGVARSQSYQRLEELIKKYAALHGVDEELVWAVMRHESGFDPRAVSPKGAMGLMQLMPGTAALLGVKDPFNVEQNIQGGIKYLEMCLTRFDQDVGLALAAYNAGPGNVEKYQGCPPFPETINYVNVVLRDLGAGVPHRGLKMGSRKVVVEDETAAPAVPPGLLWKVPIPRWKVPAPQVKISQPIWRVPRNLVISSAK
jgi:hypothetical protein